MTPSTATIPTIVTPEAAARIAELGFQTPIEQMIDHARHYLPGVVRIEVILNERYETGDQAGVTVRAWAIHPFDPDDSTQWDLTRWEVETFPSEVLEHLHVDFLAGADHAG